MSQTKGRLDDGMKDPKNWTTVQCDICCEKFPKYYSDYKEDIKRDVNTCNDCRETERGHKMH